MNKKILIISLIFVLIVVFVGCSLFKTKGGHNTITIASKNFTENIILSEIMAQAIRSGTDVTVITKTNMGSTFVVFSAIKAGEIDMYPDYTGTIYQAHLKQKETLSSQEAVYEYAKREMAKQYSLEVFKPFGFNNTYAMGMLRPKAEALGITKISDLRQHPEIIAGFDNEFIARPDGAIKMLEAYNISLDHEIVQLETGLRYKAIAEKKTDMTDVYTTDSKLKRFDMLLLEDDLNFFPSYYAVPVVRQETLKKYPKIRTILEKLGNVLNEEEMTELNYKVEEEKLKPADVAKDFLSSKGLL